MITKIPILKSVCLYKCYLPCAIRIAPSGRRNPWPGCRAVSIRALATPRSQSPAQPSGFSLDEAKDAEPEKKWNVINDQYGLACLVFSRLQLQYHNYVNLHIEWHNMASQSDCRAASQSDCSSNAKSLLPEDVDIRIVVMKMSVCIIINYKMTQLITQFNY